MKFGIMPTHTQHLKKSSFYFITFTCYGWIPLLEKSHIYDFLPKWIMEMNSKGVHNCGYVFMPNHIHMLVFVNESSRGLNHVVGEAKRFLAYEIVRRLKLHGEDGILKILSEAVCTNEKLKGKNHQVFKPSFDAKELNNPDEINKVLDYIHHNPISGKWELVDDFTDFEHSSAKFYEVGVSNQIEVFHYLDV